MEFGARVKRMHGRVHWDIVDACRRFNMVSDNHNMCDDDDEDELAWCIMRFEKSRWDFTFWDSDKMNFGTLVHADRFDTKAEARKMRDFWLLEAQLEQVDFVQSELTWDFVNEVNKIDFSYKRDEICPTCGQNAAWPVRMQGAGENYSFFPCRKCMAEDESFHVEDFLSQESPMARIQDSEPPPSFTKEDFAVVSRAAARLRIFPHSSPNSSSGGGEV